VLTATKSGVNIILKTTLAVGYQLERKLNSGAWEPWTGSGWGGVPAVLTSANFTDYDLGEGVYQYRTFVDPVYDYSDCVVIGDGAYGHTFGNYQCPEGSFGEILTPDDMRLSFLWGTQTISTNGQEWTDEQSRFFVKTAAMQLEKAINIDIYPRENLCDDELNEGVDEGVFVRKEFPYPNRRQRPGNIRMRYRPIQEVTRFDFRSPTDQQIVSLLPWMRLDKRNGKVIAYPKGGNLDYVSYGYPWLNILSTHNYPDAYHLDYKSGYKSACRVPNDLREIVGKITALKMLNMIGDGLLAGFSSSSISLDGLSESFSSTQSATSATYGARIMQYSKDIEAYIKENRNKYGNFRIGSI
jgi:hypothetical protein